MAKGEQMYKILEEMMRAADNWDTEEVKELNKEYESLAPRDYRQPTLMFFDTIYTHYRESCVTSVTMLGHIHDILVLEAGKLLKENISIIQKCFYETTLAHS